MDAAACRSSAGVAHTLASWSMVSARIAMWKSRHAVGYRLAWNEPAALDHRAPGSRKMNRIMIRVVQVSMKSKDNSVSEVCGTVSPRRLAPARVRCRRRRREIEAARRTWPAKSHVLHGWRPMLQAQSAGSPAAALRASANAIAGRWWIGRSSVVESPALMPGARGRSWRCSRVRPRIARYQRSKVHPGSLSYVGARGSLTARIAICRIAPFRQTSGVMVWLPLWNDHLSG